MPEIRFSNCAVKQNNFHACRKTYPRCDEMTTCILVRHGERWFVNPEQQMASDTGGRAYPVHLMITLGSADVPGADPKRMLDEIMLRATHVGPVLEEILLEAENQPQWGWGLNE